MGKIDVTDSATVQTTAAAPSRGLLARIVGVFTSPRATYAGVAARPRVLGALVTVVLIIAAATFAFLSTNVGRNAALDQQLTYMEAFGVHPTPEQLEQIERRTAYSAYFGVASQIVFIPVVMAIIAGIALAVFNAGLGGDATFTQAYAILAHSGFLIALQTLFVLPLNYARESMSSGTNLGVFLPMLDESSFFSHLLGSIDLFRIWWIVSLAIGFGVLYKRRTTPIAVTMLVIYGVIALVVAGVMTAFAGA
jgi:hypothetical protein